jgi:hypothetical protein
MVEGVDRLKARFAAIPEKIRAGAKSRIDEEARKVARQMEAIKPLPEIKITVGDEAGFSAGSFRGQQFGRISTKISANAYTSDFPEGTGGFPAVALWFEFGTGDRYTKNPSKYVGRITAAPYFYPVYRANRDSIRRAIASEVRKILKSGDA